MKWVIICFIEFLQKCKPHFRVKFYAILGGLYWFDKLLKYINMFRDVAGVKVYFVPKLKEI